jgi:hypothetical protein
MADLQSLLDQKDHALLMATIGAWSDKERRQVRKALLDHWKAGKEGLMRARIWREGAAHASVRLWLRLVLINILTAADARAGVAIPLPHDSLDRTPWPIGAEDAQALLQALCGKDPAWLAEYVQLISTDKQAPLMNVDVVLALIRGFTLPWPDNDGFYTAWAEHFFRLTNLYTAQEPWTREAIMLTAAHDAADCHATLTRVMATSPLEAARTIENLDRLLGALLARRDGVLRLLGRYASADGLESCASILATLVAEGRLPRRAYIAEAIAALTRGDSVTAQRMQARLLLQAEPAGDELTDHLPTLIGLLASGHGSTADAALTLLVRYDSGTVLADAEVVAAAEMVFARKEKGLRDTVLSWLGQRLKAGHAGLAALVTALTVDDHPFRQKVLKLMRAHTAAAADRVAAGEKFESLAPLLPADVCEEVGRLLGCGLASTTGRVAEPVATGSVPVISQPPRPFASRPTSAGEFAGLLAELATEPGILGSEQLIEMTVSLARQSRHDLKLALRQIYEDYPLGLQPLLQKAAFGTLPVDRVAADCRQLLARQGHDWRAGGNSWDAGLAIHMLSAVTRLRYREIALALQRGDDYPLIARPTFEHGAIDGGELVERLLRLASEGRVAGPLDLWQALMRASHPGEDGVRALRACGSPQATVAADFLAAGGMDQLRTEWQVTAAPADGSHSSHAFRIGPDRPAEPFVSLQGLAVLPAVPDIPVRWAAGFSFETAPGYWEFELVEPYLAGVLPNHGEVLAALNLWGFRKAGHDLDSSGGKAAALALPAFLKARGPAGPATHLAVLYSMSANDPAARIAGSDGLLELIAQGRYDSTLASALVTAAIDCGTVKAGRLAKSLGEAVAAGTGHELWPLLRAALASALRESPPPGTADLLALASPIARQHALREPIAGLAAIAAGKGGSKLVVEAKRLQDILGAAP